MFLHPFLLAAYQALSEAVKRATSQWKLNVSAGDGLLHVVPESTDLEISPVDQDLRVQADWSDMQKIQTFRASKNPAEVFTVRIDWDDFWLGTDTIESVAITTAGGLTVTGQDLEENASTFLVGGGTVGASGAVYVLATASGGKKCQINIIVATVAPPVA